MKVLVTGANGFVGRALCRALVQHGHELRRAVRDAESTASSDGASTFVVGDLGPNTHWDTALAGMEAVVHLAARVHVLNDTAPDALVQYRRVNVEGTRSLAVAVRRAGVRRVLLLSSAKVYGERSRQPITETDAPHPQDAYAVSKLEAEVTLEEALAGTDTQWTILRPPLIYGPEVRANFLRLLRVVARGVPLPLAAIDNRRSLLYIGNLVEVIRTCLEHEGTGGRRWVVADEEALSSPELVRRLALALNCRAHLVPVPVWLLRGVGALSGKAATVNRLVDSLQLDASAIGTALRWRPPYSVNQGLLETARWFLAARRAQP